jgi:hypothetical protein
MAMSTNEILNLNEKFDDSVTYWISDYKNFKDEYLKDNILEKTKIIAEYRKDNSLLERISQRLGD